MAIIQLYLLSFLLFMAGCFAYHKSAPTVMHRSLFFVLSLLLLLLLIGYQIADYFTGNGIDDAVVFHLKYGLGGAGFSEYAGLITSVVLLIITSVIIMAWLAFRPAQGRLKSRWVYLLLLLSLGFNPALNDLDNIVNGAFAFRQPINHGQVTEDDDFVDYYRHADINGQHGNGKNIVFIYAESLERTYFDEEVFPGLIKGLRQLETKSTYFTNIHQIYATSWTVAGMTASQCGVPLVMPSHGNSMSGMDTFMQSAVCIGDLLAGAGYYLAYMAGADLEFAGKGKLYKTHGFSEVWGRNELQARLADAEYMNAWGLYDDVMLDMVYQRFLDLSAANKPFGLFTLTLDTHHPEGHPTRSCEHIRYQDGSNKMLNSVACADYLLSNFIGKIMASPYADNTVVVLVSDHLAMKGKAYDLLIQKPRKNLFMVLDIQQRNRQVDHNGSTLDIGATVLPFLGFSTDIGLGRNLLEQDESSQEQLTYIHTHASRWQNRISALWNFPKITHALTVDADNRQMDIDGRVFRLPALVELDENMETVIKFDFDRRTREQLTLLQHRLAIADDKSFLLIDACWNVRHFKRSLGDRGLCLVAGKGRKNLYFERLAGERRYAVADIASLVNPPLFAVRPIYQPHEVSGTTAVFAPLELALDQGFEYLEVDFSLSGDGKVSCLGHRLGSQAAASDRCTLASLTAWMQKHPAASIVADIELENFEDISAALQVLPDAVNRVIPHIHNPYDFYDVRKNRFARFIWVLDGSHSQASVMDWVAQFDRAFAVAMPVANLDQALVSALKKQGIPVYAQALESPQQLQQLQEAFGISEMYTRGNQP